MTRSLNRIHLVRCHHSPTRPAATRSAATRPAATRPAAARPAAARPAAARPSPYRRTSRSVAPVHGSCARIARIVLFIAVVLAGTMQAQEWRSVRGAPIRAWTVGRGAPHILIVGGMHGDELPALELVRMLGDSLRAAPLRIRCQVTIITALNPDGIARHTRTNARGIDINRNFPARDFGVKEQKPRYYGGRRAASEPETRALMALVDSLRFSLIITVHAPLACVNYDGPSEGHAQRLAAAMGLPVKSGIGHATPGSFGTWAGRERGMPVLTLELPASVGSARMRGYVRSILEFIASVK